MDDPVSQLVARQIRSWFALMRLWFKDDGFALWDSLAVLALTHPDLFDFQRVYVSSTLEDLETGRVVTDVSRHGPVRMVRCVRDAETFLGAHFAAWQHLGQRVRDGAGAGEKPQ
jgi:inosine-uridine nucleoside N-ribohydrolase